MKRSIISNGFLVGAICFFASTAFLSCDELYDYLSGNSFAHLEWDFCGAEIAIERESFGSTQFNIDPDQNEGMWFTVTSPESYEYQNPNWKPGSSEPQLFTQPKYSFKLIVSRQSGREFALDPSGTADGKASILLIVGEGSQPPVYWESESGSVHIDNYKYIEYDAFEAKGTFTGRFRRQNSPGVICQVTGSFDVYYHN